VLELPLYYRIRLMLQVPIQLAELLGLDSAMSLHLLRPPRPNPPPIDSQILALFSWGQLG
jgi:hypothetical protein